MEGKEERYPSNAYNNIQKRPLTTSSSSTKKEEPKPIAKGKLKKPPIGKRIADSFLSTTTDDIKDAVIFDWMIPGIKNLLENMLHMILFGDKSDPRIKRMNGESSFGSIPYNKLYSGTKKNDEYIPRTKGRDPIVTFPTRKEAEKVMLAMFDEVAKYGRVSVRDLYFMADLPRDFAQSNWGWRNLTGSTVVETRDGYLLKLPKVEELK